MDNSMYTIEYRPFCFDKMVGQKGIILEMMNRSGQRNFPQVMVFEGLSGSGKTTLARIVAGVLNCHDPSEEEHNGIKYLCPCGTCPSCVDILDETFMRDVVFMDASNMGKDDVLSIQERVDTATFFDDNKVIIIDEAQELSKAGKGAALTLLEKERPNVYFILCTMDQYSLDQSLKARGQTFRFRGVDGNDIAEYLVHVLREEGRLESVPEDFFQDGIFAIAEGAEGNVRAGLQYLERCLHGQYWTSEQIQSEIGFITERQTMDLLMLLLNESPKFLEAVRKHTLKDFFYKSWNILVDARVYQLTETVDKEWKKKNIGQVAGSKNLDRLLGLYNAVNALAVPFFRDNLFLSKLVMEYYPSINPPTTTRKVKRQLTE